MSDQDTFCIVARAEGMFPCALGGYERHRTRSGGDTGNIDPSRSHLNTVLVGDEDWMRKVQAEIAAMRMENFELELSKLRQRRRKSELQKRLVEGPKAPWRGTRHGPMREILLTANAKWFDADPAREKLFEARAVAWLKTTFGEDLVHARSDRDEPTNARSS